MNLDEDVELDRILARADFTEEGEADDEQGLSQELVGAVMTPSVHASNTQEMAFRDGRVGVTQTGRRGLMPTSLPISFSHEDRITFDRDSFEGSRTVSFGLK